MTTINERKVAVIGAGSMGAALTRAFIEKGFSVTVWNRNQAKLQPLIKMGAFAAADITAAINTSKVIVICLSDYKATRHVLEANGVAASLNGKTLIQLSTGTPKDARELDTWALKQGAHCLNGDIMAW